MAVYQQELFFTLIISNKDDMVHLNFTPLSNTGIGTLSWGCVSQHLLHRAPVTDQSPESTKFQLGEPISLLELLTEHGWRVTYRSVGDPKGAAAPKALTIAWMITTPQLTKSSSVNPLHFIHSSTSCDHETMCNWGRIRCRCLGVSGGNG